MKMFVEGFERSLDAVRHGYAAVRALDDLFSAARLPPAQLDRMGRIAETLHNNGFAEAKVSQIVRALFCARLVGAREAEQQMERAFDVWDHGHRGILNLEEFSRDVSALLANDLEPLERQSLVDGLRADGSGELEYEGFREVMRAIGADGAERRSRLAALRSYGDDVGLARTALGATQAAKLSRHELRVAGSVVRVLQRELYRAEEAAALLPALGLRSPTELQLRTAFGVFDVSGSGEALDAEYVREKLSVLVPQASELVWGAAAAPSVERMREGADAIAESSLEVGGGCWRLGKGVEIIGFEEFCAMLAQLRGALASRALAVGVQIDAEVDHSWLGNVVSSVGHSAAALKALKPSESMLMPPRSLLAFGQLVVELEEAGLGATSAAAVARALFMSGSTEVTRSAFTALDLKRTGTLPMARLRLLLPMLTRHLPAADAESRVAAALADVSEDRGLEYVDFAQLLGTLSPSKGGLAGGGLVGPGLVGDALVGLGAVEAATTVGLSPLQLQRVGRIARRMQMDAYPPAAINAMVRVLFLSGSTADLNHAFSLLDREHAGSLDVASFQQILFVAGERLPAQSEIASWFAAIDLDASGRLERAEFSRLMRALRRAIASGHRSTLGTLTSNLSSAVASLSDSPLDAKSVQKLSPLERRRARRVADALQRAHFAATEVRVVLDCLFGTSSEQQLHAAFAVFDKTGDGEIDADEFREMLPLLAGDDTMSFVRVEELFKQADRDRSGVIEFTEFVWLLSNLQSPWETGAGGAADGADAHHPTTRYIKSVEELKADRKREAQQSALSARAERLRLKAEVLARASQLLHQERPLVCAELLMRMHKAELEEAKALQRSDPSVPSQSSDGLLLRGTPALLERRAEVVLRALSSLAVEERSKALDQIRQAVRSIDEEIPVTETAAHGIGRSRGLHARADRMLLIGELLNSQAGLPQASALVSELMAALKEEIDLLGGAPAALSRGSEEQMRAVRRRLAAFSQMKLMLENEQLGSAKASASTLSVRLRNDAKSVLDFATQGVYVPSATVHFPPLESAEQVSSAVRYAPMWARGRALLVAAEKIAQVVQLVRHGKRRSLQEGVQLLVAIEESDLPRLFTICKEIMRATDAEQQRELEQQQRGQARQANAMADGRAALAGNGGLYKTNTFGSFTKAVGSFTKGPSLRNTSFKTGGSSFNAGSLQGGSFSAGSFKVMAAPPRTIWWHLIDDDDDAAYDVKELADWAATRDLSRARLQLMSTRKGGDGISTLEKLRADLLLYARDAC